MSENLHPKNILGHDAEYAEASLGRVPDETILLEDGKRIWKYLTGEIREIHLNATGQIFRCNYSEERRRYLRVTPAHFISTTLDTEDGDSYQGMILDLAVNSMRIKVKGKFAARSGETVSVSFSTLEGGEHFPIRISNSVIVRTQLSDQTSQVVVAFPCFEFEHVYAKYIACRHTEIEYGKKFCERKGLKCRANLLSEINNV